MPPRKAIRRNRTLRWPLTIRAPVMRNVEALTLRGRYSPAARTRSRGINDVGRRPERGWLVTSADIVTLVAVPGEASDTDASEQLSDDDGAPLNPNRLVVKRSVTQTGPPNKCTGLPQTAGAPVPAEGSTALLEPRRLWQRCVDCVGPTL
jgi:hypothetical protein